MNVLLSLVLVCVSIHLTAASWTSAHRNQILKIHNDYRKGTKGACGMNMMTYDTELENEAKAWAKGCAFEHQQKGRGENIAWYTKYGKESMLVQKMAKMWYDEIKDFDYNAYSCGAACHYTQMVWSKSTKLGCYAEDCAQLRGGGSNAYFLVCFYNPAGNMMGEKPYKKDCSGKTNNNNNNNNNNKVSPGNSNNNNNNNNGWEPWNPTTNNKNNNNGWQPWQPDNNNGWFPATGNNNGWRVITSNGGNNGWPSGNNNNNNNGWKVVSSRSDGKGGRIITWSSNGKK